MIREKIIRELERITGYKSIKLDVSDNLEHGDYATNIALIESKRQNKNPLELAKEIKDKISRYKDIEILEKIEVAGPGFLNFWIKEEALKQEIDSNLKLEKGKKYMVEFAHPNTHKAFHIGHLRNIITGECLVRLLEVAGNEVVRANYQGDVGLHIAKALFGIQKIGFREPESARDKAQYLSEAYVLGNSEYEENEQSKERIIQINKSLYSKSDEELNILYEKTRQWSLDYFESIYKRVDSHFDRYYFESEIADRALELIREAKEKGILEESDRATVYKGEKDGLHTRVFLTREGNPTYEGKDLALAELQFKEYNPEKIIHIVGPEQTEYFKVVFKVIEKLFPEHQDKELHVPYGWVKLKDGKMSSRKGNVVLGEWLLDEAKNKILEKYKTNPDIAEEIAIGAVKYSFLKAGLNQEIAFDINESISLEGNSGPYLQYTYARTQSVLQKSIASSSRTSEARSGIQIPHKKILRFHRQVRDDMNQEERAVLFTLSRFTDVLVDAAETYSPNTLCNYLFELAQNFNTFYNAHKIVGSENEEFRLWLTGKTGERIKKGLELLGIKSPSKM